jgi:hypothetical protein
MMIINEDAMWKTLEIKQDLLVIVNNSNDLRVKEMRYFIYFIWPLVDRAVASTGTDLAMMPDRFDDIIWSKYVDIT